jgi:hypothetical protein
MMMIALVVAVATTYRKNIKTHHIYEDDSCYKFSIPGISIKEFNQRFSDFKAKPGHVAKAFEQLLKNGIIQPIMKFRDELRYVLADYKLFYLIKDIRTVFELDSHFNAMGQQFCPPAYQEVEKRKLWYTDEVLVEKFFNTRELYRDAFKKQMKNQQNLQNSSFEIFTLC